MFYECYYYIILYYITWETPVFVKTIIILDVLWFILFSILKTSPDAFDKF